MLKQNFQLFSFYVLNIFFLNLLSPFLIVHIAVVMLFVADTLKH